MDRIEWMAEVCRAAALTMEAHGLGSRTEQLRNVADQLAAAPHPPAEQASGDDALAKLAEVLPPKPMPGDDYGFQMSPERLRVLHDRFAALVALSQRPAEQVSGELPSLVMRRDLPSLVLRRDSDGKMQLFRSRFNLRFATFSPGVLESERCAVFAALSQRPVWLGIDWAAGYRPAADAALVGLRQALQSYVRTVAHIRRVANPEDWATYGDWDRLERDAKQALGDEP